MKFSYFLWHNVSQNKIESLADLEMNQHGHRFFDELGKFSRSVQLANNIVHFHLELCKLLHLLMNFDVVDFDLLHAQLLDFELIEQFISTRIPFFGHLGFGRVNLSLNLLLVLVDLLHLLVLRDQLVVYFFLVRRDDLSILFHRNIELRAQVKIALVALGADLEKLVVIVSDVLDVCPHLSHLDVQQVRHVRHRELSILDPLLILLLHLLDLENSALKLDSLSCVRL